MTLFRKLSIILFIGLFTFTFSSSADAAIQRRHKPRRVIGTPLDGGLLAVLGAAGVSYYLIRKKKKNSTEI
jgi:hypothetical protein